MNVSPLHATDFYKVQHRLQYPSGTQMVYSNFTPRSDKLANVLPDFDHKVVVFGLQGVVKWLLMDKWNADFFQRPKAEILDRYKRRMDMALGVGAVSVEHIGALHDLGFLPIEIRAIKEGSRVNTRVPHYSIHNTKPEFFWLVNYLETQLSAETWKPSTNATTAYEYRRLLDQYAALTGSPREFVPWQGHDFSFRGMSGIHDAASSGAAHLLSFTGTDTIVAIDFLEDYYHGSQTFIGGSVPATEHSVMCMGGAEDEVATIRRIIADVYPAGIVSIVSDTWDFWNVVTVTAERLKDVIMGRQPDVLGNAKTVFRPDSGDPVKIIAGDPSADPGSPEFKGAVECLWDIFGGTYTDPQGYRVLDSHVGLIYGDSITLDRASRILAALEAKGFASCNVVFGIGSFTYQYVTRDSYGSAVKATYGIVDGVPRALFKAPKTDSGTKNSARGLLRVEKMDDITNDFVLKEMQTWEEAAGGELEPMFRDGVLLRDETLSDIRKRLLG